MTRAPRWSEDRIRFELERQRRNKLARFAVEVTEAGLIVWAVAAILLFVFVSVVPPGGP